MKKKIDLKLGHFLQIVAVFWVIAFFSFATAASMSFGKVAYTQEPVQSIYMPPIENQLPPYKPAEIDVFQFLISFLFATALMLAFIKTFKGKFIFEVFFSGAIIFGSQGPLGILFGKIEAFFISICVVFLRFLHPRIWTQNLAIILGISGISAGLGMSVRPTMAAIILILLSIYDIIAVYKTRHMISLFKGMAERGAILALIVPQKFSDWVEKFTIIKPYNKNDFIFLGTGDLALPVFFAVSTHESGILFFLLIIFGATLGFLADHLFFMLQAKRKPIPALPFISIFSLMGYALALFVSI